MQKLDIESANKLHYNDVKRVIRALEIYESGIKKSDIVDDFKPKYDYRAYCIDHERETLYQRIDKRVDIMVNSGLIEEIKGLINNGVDKYCQCMQAIGYKEVLEYLDGQLTLEQAVDKIKLNTRHYAKRQITFFKKLNVEKLQPNDTKLLAKKIVEGLNNDR